MIRARSVRVPRLDFELSQGCDHKCAHCYNVWNARPGDAQDGYPSGQLPTPELLRMMEKAIDESGAEHVTITGGEPLLRKDALAIIERLCSKVPSVQLITNGSHVTPDVAALLARIGVRSVQLTLLSADRATHDRLKGAECFDATVRACVDLIEAGVPVQVCFVSMAENWRELEGVIELCYALGVKAIVYNRMSPTGWAVHEIERLLPNPEQVEHNLETAERLCPAFGISVTTAMPIPPCLIRLDRFRHIRFGFCSVGTSTPNITIDGLGNVRSCNLSSHVMGNVRQQEFAEIYADPYFHGFKSKVPEICRGCHYERSCQGGCKESAFATYGNLGHPEPFLQQALHGGAAQPARVGHRALPVIGA
jgi:radical SAM protein with 4Fe4S-binding SPASM domain